MKVIGKDVVFIRANEVHARQGEGDFIRLKNGAIMYAYSEFSSGGGDFDKSVITAIYSYDDGETFTDKRVLFDLEEGETQNLCVSFLRLKNGDIAIFYGVRGKRQDVMMRVSSDEGLTFSKPTPIINKEGYYVYENGRVLRSKSGRILLPLNKHEEKENGGIGPGHFTLFYSDDDGKTWIDSNNYISHPDGEIWQGLQETGLTQFDDGTIFAFSRTNCMTQYECFSYDDGLTFTTPRASIIFSSPLSPMTIKRVEDKFSVAVYNPVPSYAGRDFIQPCHESGRTPYMITVVDGDGSNFFETCYHRNFLLEDDLENGYAYASVFTGEDYLLVAYYHSDGYKKGVLKSLKIKKIAFSELEKA